MRLQYFQCCTMIEKSIVFENLVFIYPDRLDWNLKNKIHVWKFPVSAAGETLLSDAEVMISRRFRFEADRNRFVTGRRSLRFLISKYLSVNPLDIEIVAERGKKPFIRYPDTHVRFNISHSGQWVVVALSYEELGIDIEKINLTFDYSILLEDHFTFAEQRFVVNAEVPATAFYCLWTRKEALLKAAGGGLQEKLNVVSVLDEQNFAEFHKKKWKISSFSLSADYSVSLAYCGSPEEIGYFDGSLLISPQVQSK